MLGDEALDAGDALGVGQTHVEQHAVGVAHAPAGVGQVGDALDAGAGQAVGQQLADDQGVGVVVLDQQDAPAHRLVQLGGDAAEGRGCGDVGRHRARLWAAAGRTATNGAAGSRMSERVGTMALPG